MKLEKEKNEKAESDSLCCFYIKSFVLLKIIMVFGYYEIKLFQKNRLL